MRIDLHDGAAHLMAHDPRCWHPIEPQRHNMDICGTHGAVVDLDLHSIRGLEHRLGDVQQLTGTRLNDLPVLVQNSFLRVNQRFHLPSSLSFIVLKWFAAWEALLFVSIYYFAQN